jgi:hypothetical protein
MDPIKANFLLIKVKEDIWDVAIFADEPVLKAFQKVYNAHYVDKSVFGKEPMCVIPEFPNQLHAKAWKQYWLDAFADPDNSCESCPTVKELFEFIKEYPGNE